MGIKDLEAAIDAVSKVYCRHSANVEARVASVDLDLEVGQAGSQSLIRMSYGAPVSIDAGNFSNLFLIKHCERGAATASQDFQSAECRAGETLPLSAGHATQLRFDATFVQRSVKFEAEKVEAHCARILGHPLDEPLKFELRPFSREFEHIWQRTLSYMWPAASDGLHKGHAADNVFDEYLLTLLLHNHPHNYTDELTGHTRAPVPGLVRRAERFIRDNAAAQITIADVASHAGVSLRSLQAGFRQWRNTSPNAYLAQTRLQMVRDALQRPQQQTSVTDIALQCGFSHLGRFSAQYREAFGEAPSATLRRRR